ncbi:MAG TPA: hypothetical protein VGK20_04075 [Candidatus Binatia bacterium]
MATAAVAGPSPADKCEASKNKLAGQYYSCREKAEAVAISTAGTPDYSACTTKFGAKWDSAEGNGGGMCPDNVATAQMDSYIAAQTAATAAILSGAKNIPTCGDGVVNAVGEHCDGSDLDGYSCSSFGYIVGQLACTGTCDFNASACNNICPGEVYAGACFFLGAAGDSCDDACGAQGMSFDNATITVAGSGGTDVACQQLLDDLGAPGTGLDFPSDPNCGLGVGCSYQLPSLRGRCTVPATTSSAGTGGVARICACH